MSILNRLPPNALPARELSTERLTLRASSVDLAAAVSDFHRRNHDHLAPWEPARAADHWTIEATSARLNQEVIAFGGGSMWRYWLVARDDPARVIGQCQISQVQRGCFQSAMLGYSLDAGMTSRGLMDEGLRALIGVLFSQPVRLHRLQAAVRLDNPASRRVLERLGFRSIGISRDYLFINGAWRDHELWSLVNPDWPGDEAPEGV